MYTFPGAAEFRDRDAELHELETWWADASEWRAMALYGRRRVGKSWLFRMFAHGKPGDIFVADSRAERDQLTEFARQLEPELGLRPSLPDIGSFFELLYRRAHDGQRLVVVDEFPYLLQTNRALPSILLRIMEEHAQRSQLKLILCGSIISTMEELFAERNPLHDRLQPLPITPLSFAAARSLLPAHGAQESVERYAVAGGMPRYLVEIGKGQSLADVVGRRVLNRLGPLFNEPRSVLSQELRVPHSYFSILAALAGGPIRWDDLVSRSGIESKSLSAYLETLHTMHLIGNRQPVTDRRTDARRRQYFIKDGFLRFWFRFVFPHQAELEEGTNPAELYRSAIRPQMADFVAPVFEELARDWVRRASAFGAPRVGAWWGPSLHSLRRRGMRTSEEIDVVAIDRGRIMLVGEARWRSERMDVSIVNELLDFKLPALRQVPNLRMASSLQIALFSRSGFTRGLEAVARERGDLRLIGLEELIGTSGE